MNPESLDNLSPISPPGVEGCCPHFVVEHFLGDAVVQQLLAHVDQKRAKFMPATVYRQQRQTDVADVESRNCLRLAQIGPFEAAIRSEILRVLPSVLMKLGLLDRQVVAREFEFCVGNGRLFRAHHDILPQGRPRIVSCVYYFFREPADSFENPQISRAASFGFMAGQAPGRAACRSSHGSTFLRGATISLSSRAA